MNKPETIEDLLKLAPSYHKEPLKAELLEGTPFYKNVVNLVYGLSKSGKTYSIAKVLVEAGLTKNDVIWLDKDFNIDEPLLAYMKQFHHINSNIKEFEDLLLCVEGKGKIVVFDSLKDFLDGNDIDSNTGSQNTMEYIRQFISMGYTVIIIAHATRQSDSNTSMKIKGNEETIKSKSDIIFALEKNSDYRALKIVDSRITNTHKNDVFKLYSLEKLKEKIDKILKEYPNLTVRELQNKLPSAVRDTFKTNQDKLIKVAVEGKKHIAKCI